MAACPAFGRLPTVFCFVPICSLVYLFVCLSGLLHLLPFPGPWLSTPLLFFQTSLTPNIPDDVLLATSIPPPSFPCTPDQHCTSSNTHPPFSHSTRFNSHLTHNPITPLVYLASYWPSNVAPRPHQRVPPHFALLCFLLTTYYNYLLLANCTTSQ